MRDRANVLNLSIDRLTMEESIERAKVLIRSGGGHQHVVVNAAKIVACKNNEALRETINGCSIVNADGQSVVWASRLLRDPLPERVAGIDFMDRLVAEAAVEGFTIFLLGAKPDVVQEVARSFRERGANIVGVHDGYWRQDGWSDAELVAEISSCSPDILFVAIPSPFKEDFLSANLHQLSASLCVGVGGSFDVVAGLTKRAPLLLQRTGLEWVFRLLQEPRRMFKRYLVGNSKFIIMVTEAFLKKKVGQRSKWI